MRLHIEYRSHYEYDAPVWESQNELRACPATDPWQRLERYRVEITPAARVVSYVDAWGTRVDTFGVRAAHDSLDIRVEAVVDTLTRASGPEPSISPSPMPIDADAADVFLAPSSHVQWGDALARDARRIADAHGDALSVARALHDHVGGFDYAPGETYIGVGVDEVVEAGRGVCQDFAHVLIAMCRSAGIAARYVSGYLYSAQDERRIDLEAAVAMSLQTHAWVEVLVPGSGWLALDPTNRRPVGEEHVVIGRGRDYDDVAPLRGVYAGSAQQVVDVDVRIRERELAMQRAAQQ